VTATAAGPASLSSSAGWRDSSGCLTSSGFQAVATAPASKVPPELAAHLAKCALCQERLLAADRPPGARRPKATAPPPWRIVLVFGAAVLLVLSVLFTLHWLTAAS
jgi:hypothetical protein